VTADAANVRASYERFAQAVRNAEMQSYLLGQSGKGPTKLGSTTTDQVFIPIVPCRIVDTRNVGGPISAGFTRNFNFYASSASFDWATQGGAAGTASSTCPGTVNPNGGAPSAAVVTVQVVSPSAAGNWILWGGASPIPTISGLNWTGPGQILANTTVIPSGGRTGPPGPGGAILDFAVAYNGPTGSAQLVADVVGYLVENQATALQCVQVNSGNVIIPPNTSTSADASCPTGYTLTGGGFLINEGSGGVVNDWLWTSYPVGPNTWRTNWSNQTGANRNGVTYAVCCRVPGK
jgi:hypothetical protein